MEINPGRLAELEEWAAVHERNAARLTWSDDERAALDDIRRACRFQSDADAIRGALWWYARFLELDVPSDVFALALPAATRAHVRSAVAAPAARSEAADDQSDLGCEEHEGFLG